VKEPLSTTVLRTFSVAALVATIISIRTQTASIWTAQFCVVLWVSFGGHWLELFYINTLKKKLPKIDWPFRLVFWFACGVLLSFPMNLTRDMMEGNLSDKPEWWAFGLGFIAVELLVHALFLQSRGLPSVYNCKG
jgi:uncharacterized membrane protein